MADNWDLKPDRGPRFGDDNARHRRKRGKKCFVIERRYIGPEVEGSPSWLYKRHWHCFRSYETESALQNALIALKKSPKWTQWLKKFEFRTNQRNA